MDSYWGPVLMYAKISDDVTFIIASENQGLQVSLKFIEGEGLPQSIVRRAVEYSGQYYFEDGKAVDTIYFCVPSILCKYIDSTHAGSEPSMLRKLLISRFRGVYNSVKKGFPQLFGGGRSVQALHYREYVRSILNMSSYKVLEVLEEDVGLREMIPNRVYIVTKGNTDESILAGDIIFIDPDTGDVCGTSFLSGDDFFDKSMTDFKCRKEMQGEWRIRTVRGEKKIIKAPSEKNRRGQGQQCLA